VVVDFWEVIVIEKTRLEKGRNRVRRSAADVQIWLATQVGYG
jgi:hypothetical protein